MNNFSGVIIEESLADKEVLQIVKILKTEVELATEEDKTPWLEKWTLHTVEITESGMEKIAIQLSESFDAEHKSSWYADFKNDTTHYVIFPNKIFKVDRSTKGAYDAVLAYGRSLGIPAHQLDFER